MASRLDDMLQRYGECVTKTRAAAILGCSVSKVKVMLRDGRLRTVCAGSMVDVRSIAAYIETPAAADDAARLNRIKLRYGTEYAV